MFNRKEILKSIKFHLLRSRSSYRNVLNTRIELLLKEPTWNDARKILRYYCEFVDLYRMNKAKWSTWTRPVVIPNIYVSWWLTQSNIKKISLPHISTTFQILTSANNCLEEDAHTWLVAAAVLFATRTLGDIWKSTITLPARTLTTLILDIGMLKSNATFATKLFWWKYIQLIW